MYYALLTHTSMGMYMVAANNAINVLFLYPGYNTCTKPAVII